MVKLFKLYLRTNSIGLQCFCNHEGAEVGPADTDVDHVGDLFAGVALPLAADNTVAKVLQN